MGSPSYMWSVVDRNFYTITLRNFVVPTRCLLGDLFRETGVVHRIIYSFNYLFFTCFIYSIYC